MTAQLINFHEYKLKRREQELSAIIDNVPECVGVKMSEKMITDICLRARGIYK